MRIIEQTLYTFHELSDEAKKNAIEYFQQNQECNWMDESRESIEDFCSHFGVKLKNYSVGAYCSVDYSTDAENRHFRNVKLKDVNRDYMPTGYCLDCDLWITFYDVFKASGNAFLAFNEAIHAGFVAWRNDLEWQCSEEYISEFIEANDYEFTENGKLV